MKIYHLGTWNIPISWQTVGILGLFQVHGKNVLIKNMVHTCVFQENHKNLLYFAKKMQEISALEANIGSFHQISVKYLPFSHTSISLMTKELTKIKVYTYFNIGDTKALVNFSHQVINWSCYHCILFIKIN